MDSDLAESISALKSSLEQRGADASFGRADAPELQRLTQKLRLPRRYGEFLLECDPVEVEIATPAETLRLVPSAELEAEQKGFAADDSGEILTKPTTAGWRPGWIVVAHSSLLGDPYFLDTGDPDAEGDCPVYTAMTGTESWQPKLCASSFAMFVRILATGLEVAQGFDVDDYDADNEQVFREALGPKIRQFDPAAVKAGHWT